MSDLDPKFKTVGSFDIGAPADRQVQQLEDNVGAALDALAMQAWAKLTPTNTKTADYSAALDELVVTSATLTVKLPIASAQNAGQVVGVVVAIGKTVTTFAASGLVQGVARDSIPAGGWLYISTGVGWWRTGGVTTVTVGTGLTGGGTGAVAIGIDSGVLVTSTALDAAVMSTRQEVEKLRVLVSQLIKVELGRDDLDNGWEAACA